MRACAAAPAGAEAATRADVAIIGGGPCGLLTAYALMGEDALVSRPPPGAVSVQGGARNYQLGINAMGQNALAKIDGGREDGPLMTGLRSYSAAVKGRMDWQVRAPSRPAPAPARPVRARR